RKPRPGTKFGGTKEELVYSPLAIRQPVAHEEDVISVVDDIRMRPVFLGIERVVYRYAGASTQALVCLDDRRTAPIGEDAVEAGDQLGERIFRVGRYTGEGRWRVDIQKRGGE